MKGIFCCLGGASTSKIVQDPEQQPEPPQQLEPPQQPEPSEPRDSSESIDDEGELGIELPDDHLSYGVTYRWSEIVNGTENFELTHLRGNFGKVYRCDFPTLVGAAKIHDHENQLGNADEFLAEIRTLQEANHPNVIRLIGKYFGQKKSAIVYEFMPNGSLDHHLYANVGRGPGLVQETRVLDWETRMRIAVGVAEALVYLHTGIKTIHRDVKVSNVLLDDDYAPKLADFGLAAKIGDIKDGVDQPRNINPVKGTRGYIAPETEESGLVSTKSDIYSYGVFLFVLFTGRRAYDLKRPAAAVRITDWLRPVWSREEFIPMVTDAALGNKFPVEGLNSLFKTARMCIDAQANSRPQMVFVEDMVRQAAAYPVPELLPVTERWKEI